MTEVGRELDRDARRRRIRRAPQRTASRRSVDRRSADRDMLDRISHRTAITTGTAWALGLATILLLEPAAAEPEALSALAELFGTIVAMGLSVTILGLVTRHRFGLGAAAVAGGLMLAASLACPVSGHHTFGAWWIGELAILTGMTALAVTGYRRASGTGE